MRGISWKQFLKDLKNNVSDHNVYNGAATLAYYMMLSIFPAAIFLLSLLPFQPITHMRQAIMELLGQVMPKESASLFTGIVNEVVPQSNGGLLSFGVIFLVWFASSGLYPIMNQLNITLGIKDSRPFWKARGTAVLLRVLFFVLVVGGFSLIIFGGVMQNWLGNELGWSRLLLIFFAALRWGVILALMLLAFESYTISTPMLIKGSGLSAGEACLELSC